MSVMKKDPLSRPDTAAPEGSDVDSPRAVEIVDKYLVDLSRILTSQTRQLKITDPAVAKARLESRIYDTVANSPHSLGAALLQRRMIRDGLEYVVEVEPYVTVKVKISTRKMEGMS